MTILEQLWQDHTASNRLSPSPAEKALNDTILKNHEKLVPMLSPDAREIYGRLTDCREELAAVNDCEIFIEGFRMGARVMLEVMEKTGGGGC